jgi:hypothetical protein
MMGVFAPAAFDTTGVARIEVPESDIAALTDRQRRAMIVAGRPRRRLSLCHGRSRRICQRRLESGSTVSRPKSMGPNRSNIIPFRLAVEKNRKCPSDRLHHDRGQSRLGRTHEQHLGLRVLAKPSIAARRAFSAASTAEDPTAVTV